MAQQSKLDQEIALREQQLKAVLRHKAVGEAKSNLIEFSKLTMPHPDAMDDVRKSRYHPAAHHRMISNNLKLLMERKIERLIVNMPPRHGKSELTSRRFLAWYIGNNPSHEIIFITYNQEFADDFGGKVREILRSEEFKQVFSDVELSEASQSKSRLEIKKHGGSLSFVGIGGAVTGRGADLLVIDDPIKGKEDAQSETLRNKVWDFYTTVATTRLSNIGVQCIILTRWHDDDIIGRIDNPDYMNPKESDQFKRLVLPAIKDNGEYLWPERFSPQWYEAKRNTLLPSDFSALYQQNPTPADGLLIKSEDLMEYSIADLAEIEKGCQWYGFSDHAVSLKQERDCTAMGLLGIDKNNNVFIHPHVFWQRASTDVVVEKMIDMMEMRRPVVWGAEKGHISQSFGPFLRKRMQERGVFVAIHELTPVKDKVQRAQSLIGLIAMRKVYFPRFAPWYPDARTQLLQFPNGKHDDFVDMVSWGGIYLQSMFGRREKGNSLEMVKTGTLGWVKAAAARDKREMAMKQQTKGW